MKKSVLTIAIVLGITLGAFAQGGLFQYGAVSDEDYYGASRSASQPLLPFGHNLDEDIDGQTGQPVPVGSGAALLIGLGATYLVGKKRKES